MHSEFIYKKNTSFFVNLFICRNFDASRQFGFIPNICSVLETYDLSKYLNQNNTVSVFLSRFQWKGIVNSAILKYHKNQLMKNNSEIMLTWKAKGDHLHFETSHVFSGWIFVSISFSISLLYSLLCVWTPYMSFRKADIATKICIQQCAAISNSALSQYLINSFVW